MKASLAASLLAPALAYAEWWNGAPDCAHSCLSSAWASSTDWPSPGTYCTSTAAPIATCLSSACSATPTAWSSYSSLSSDLCSRWASCSSAGSTGVYTITATGPWGPGGTWGPGGHPGGGPGGGPGGWGPHGTHTYSSGGVYTVTGCPWDGSPWFGGPGAGWGGWGDWGSGWQWHTRTTTATVTYTSGGSTIVSTGPATVGEAVSGSTTSTTTFGVGAAAAAPTNAAPADNAHGVKVMGAVLGGVVAVAGML